MTHSEAQMETLLSESAAIDEGQVSDLDDGEALSSDTSEGLASTEKGEPYPQEEMTQSDSES